MQLQIIVLRNLIFRNSTSLGRFSTIKLMLRSDPNPHSAILETWSQYELHNGVKRTRNFWLLHKWVDLTIL